jgi:response regulator RpfG family c-di-GMP phosphodiesterase
VILPILVADPDAAFLESLRAAPEKMFALPPLTATHGKEAHDLLADTSRGLSGIFINPGVTSPSGIKLIRFAHQYRPAVPIYVLHDSRKAPFTPQELRHLGVHHAIPKPVSCADLLKYVLPVPIDFGGTLQLSATGQETHAHAEAIAEVPEDHEFFPVQVESFLVGADCALDLYLRLASGKHIKILNAGDAFTDDQMQHALKKGVKRFYVRKEAQERYLEYCDEFATQFLKDPTASVDQKVTQMVRHGEETMHLLKSIGFKELHLQHGTKFVDQLNELVGSRDLNRNIVFKAFMANLAALEHGAGTAIVAALVSQYVKVHTSVRVIGVASLFHDIGLFEMPVEIQDEDESRMTVEQKALFYTHPEVSARILTGTGDMDPLALQAVAQHHMRLGKRGFPAHAKIAKVNHEAELVGICDEFVRILQKTKVNPRLHPFQEMERLVFEGFSNPIVEAFRNFFFLTLL